MRVEVRPKAESPNIPRPNVKASNPLSGVEVAVRWVKAADVQQVRDAAWEIAVAQSVETAKINARHSDAGATKGGQVSTSIVVGSSGSVNSSTAAVMDCIKAHESGNYSESSHPGSGSGAFQVIPQTWNAWSARAGFPGYSYAYLAPPAVQDAVVAYMLTHGGAANWSVRFGPDPCTGN